MERFWYENLEKTSTIRFRKTNDLELEPFRSSSKDADKDTVKDPRECDMRFQTFLIKIAEPGEFWYRGTSLIRKCVPLEPYSRTMPRASWWS